MQLVQRIVAAECRRAIRGALNVVEGAGIMNELGDFTVGVEHQEGERLYDRLRALRKKVTGSDCYRDLYGNMVEPNKTETQRAHDARDELLGKSHAVVLVRNQYDLTDDEIAQLGDWMENATAHAVNYGNRRVDGGILCLRYPPLEQQKEKPVS